MPSLAFFNLLILSMILPETSSGLVISVGYSDARYLGLAFRNNRADGPNRFSVVLSMVQTSRRSSSSVLGQPRFIQ